MKVYNQVHMWILLPVAGISKPLSWLVGIGAVVGFVSGLFGVSGGFLLTPILIMIGIPPTVAAASDSCQIVAGSSSGTAAHYRLGNVDVKLGIMLLLGGLSGGWVGVHIIKILRLLGSADYVITITYVLMLGVIGSYMLRESLRSLRRGASGPNSHVPARGLSFLAKLPFQMDFPRSQVRHSALVPFFLCGLVGILATIMGVGGGFIMVPMMVYLLRIPMHVAVGTDLFQILFTCAGVTYMQATTNHTVDLVLALLVAAGSTVGAQIGARVGKRLRGDQIKILLASVMLIVMLKMAIGLFIARPGQYEVHPCECGGGQIVASSEVPLKVIEAGFPAVVAWLASQHPSCYGIISVLLALLAGFSIDFVATRLFKRKMD